MFLGMVTIYARCGVVDAAHCQFIDMPRVEALSWNAMVAAPGQHEQGIRATELFEEMLVEDMLSDRISFLTAISARSHTPDRKSRLGRKTFEACNFILF